MCSNLLLCALQICTYTRRSKMLNCLLAHAKTSMLCYYTIQTVYQNQLKFSIHLCRIKWRQLSFFSYYKLCYVNVKFTKCEQRTIAIIIINKYPFANAQKAHKHYVYLQSYKTYICKSACTFQLNRRTRTFHKSKIIDTDNQTTHTAHTSTVQSCKLQYIYV